jgi:hypothetical protein
MRYNHAIVKRLLRILFNAAMVLSLVLCAATLVEWVRSRWSADGLIISAGIHNRPGETHAHGLFVGSLRGHVSFFYLHAMSVQGPITNVPPRGVQWRTAAPASVARTAARHGFLFDRRIDTYAKGGYHGSLVAVVPHWFLAGMTTIPPMLRLWVWRRARRPYRRNRGLRVTCGYDFRATPDRCPECGTISGS